MYARYFIQFFTILLFCFGLTVQAQHDAPEQHTTEESKGFNAKEMILDHVKDSYDWHIAGEGHHSISIPLPVILYSDKGVDVFLSSKFEHGHAEYQGYALSHGKIVRPDGAKFLDFSITKNVYAIFFSVILLCVVMISIANRYKANPNTAPKGLQALLEPVILMIRDDIAKTSIGPTYAKYVPYLLTLFFFIFINNALGLIPIPLIGGTDMIGNISITLVLGVVTYLVVIFNAKAAFWGHIFNPHVPVLLKPLMLVIELMGFFIKPFILALRLFANITAGHIIALSFISLIFIFANKYGVGGGFGSSLVAIPFVVGMSLLECLVAYLQAFVFTLLAAIYIGTAVAEPAHAEHH